MKRWLRRQLERAGYVLFNTRHPRVYARDGLFTHHRQPFLSGARFQRAYARGVAASAGHDPRTEWRVHVALWAAEQALSVPGDFVECGVNAGFVSSAIMDYLDWNGRDKRYFLVDTFSGPVEDQFSAAESKQLAAVRDAVATGGYVTEAARAEANFAEWPSAHVIQGAVPGVLAKLEIPRVAFLHIDMNCAYPEREALRFFWPRIAPGGLVLFDDYTYSGHDSLTEALDQTAAECGAGILALPTGQGLMIKAPDVDRTR